MATKSYHIILQDINGQKTSTTIEVVDSVTAATLETFINTQSSAKVVGISESKDLILSGTDVADEGSDVDDKIFLTFKSKAGKIRRWVISAPETGFKAAWLVATPQGLRVTKTKGDAFATELSTALGLTGNDVLMFQSGFFKHTK